MGTALLESACILLPTDPELALRGEPEANAIICASGGRERGLLLLPQALLS